MLRKIIRPLNQLFRYPLAGIKGNLFFLFYNPFLYGIRAFQMQAVPEKKEIARILLCCRAALGDVLIACSLIPVIRRYYPMARIGFLCTPETKQILETQKGIDFIHVVKRSSFRESKKDVKSIQEVGYDLSIELHPFFPNSISFVTRAKIPKRIGFDSGGYDLLLTDPVLFPEKREYLPYVYGELVKKIGIMDFFPSLEIELTPFKYEKEYLVLHLGTSDVRKEWELFKWRDLAKQLHEKGFFLFFTGKGRQEKAKVEEIFNENFGKNVCDEQTWTQFASLILGAKAVISVDSLAVHLAALQKVPVVGLYLYSHGVELWMPRGEHVSWLVGKKAVRENREASHPKATYLQEIEVFDVLNSLQSLMNHDIYSDMLS